MARYKRQLDLYNRQLKNLTKHPFWNRHQINETKIKIQALEEGARDELTTLITQSASTTAGVVDKNNYTSYDKQVTKAYEMYEAISEYGAELFGGVLDTRAAFIGGEGISVKAGSPASQKYCEEFLDKNKLRGTRLLSFITTGELEGKNLLILIPNKDKDEKKSYIKAREFLWEENRYQIIADRLDKDDIKKITYKDKSDDEKEKTIDISRAVYVKLGGTAKDINKTTHKLHRVITDFENYSRAKYDLRKNTHVFGKYMPYWKVGSKQEADAINNAVQAKDWEIGVAYAGTAEFSLVEPTGSAADSVVKDMLNALKCISATSGIPLQFLAWPELLSNRATADNLMEMVRVSTAKERLIWEESFKALIEKSMILAVDKLGADNRIISDVSVTLDFVTISLLEQITKIWQPLWADDVISIKTLRSKLPGVDPEVEKKLIEKEEKENGEKSVLNNKATDDAIKKLQEETNGTDENGGQQRRPA